MRSTGPLIPNMPPPPIGPDFAEGLPAISMRRDVLSSLVGASALIHTSIHPFPQLDRTPALCDDEDGAATESGRHAIRCLTHAALDTPSFSVFRTGFPGSQGREFQPVCHSERVFVSEGSRLLFCAAIWGTMGGICEWSSLHRLGRIFHLQSPAGPPSPLETLPQIPAASRATESV